MQCAFEDLTVDTVFLGFHPSENTTAEEMTKKILIALKFKDEEWNRETGDGPWKDWQTVPNSPET